MLWKGLEKDTTSQYRQAGYLGQRLLLISAGLPHLGEREERELERQAMLGERKQVMGL